MITNLEKTPQCSTTVVFFLWKAIKHEGAPAVSAIYFFRLLSYP